MIIITNRELPIHINAEYEDWLFWGIYEDKDKAKIPEIYKEAIKELTDRNDKYQKRRQLDMLEIFVMQRR